MTPQQQFQTVQPQQPHEQASVKPHPANLKPPVTPQSRFQTGQPVKPAGVAGPPKPAGYSSTPTAYQLNPDGTYAERIDYGKHSGVWENIKTSPEYQAFLKSHKGYTPQGYSESGQAGAAATGAVKDWSFLNDPKYKGLPGLDAYQRIASGKSMGIYDNQSQIGMGLGNNLQQFAQNQDPAKVKAHLDQLIVNKQQDALYNQYFRKDQHGHAIPQNPKIKYNTVGPGGAHFGNHTFFHQGPSKILSKTVGAGLYDIGIDPRDPNSEALASAWIRAHANDPNWQKMLGNNKWGRFDAKVPGLEMLRAQFPKATNAQLLDAVVRMTHSQAALDPVDDTMSILGPLIVAAGVFLAPAAVGALGGTVGAGAGATMSMGTAQALGGALGGTISSGIQSNWDPTSTFLGAAGGAAAGGFNPFAGGGLSGMAGGVSPTTLAINTAIQESANIDPNLALALSFANAGYGALKTGNFSQLARKGAGYVFGKTVPGLPGKIGEYAINNYRSAPQKGEDKVRS
jgi:hypothetical protein